MLQENKQNADCAPTSATMALCFDEQQTPWDERRMQNIASMMILAL
jgi:hypothetical protein